jgi:hypothetical protein
MFGAHCPRCDRVGLYGVSRMRGLVNSPLGIELTFECYCGEILTILTGWGPQLTSSAPGAPRR